MGIFEINPLLKLVTNRHKFYCWILPELSKILVFGMIFIIQRLISNKNLKCKFRHYSGVQDDVFKTFKISESFRKPCLHQKQDNIFGGKFDFFHAFGLLTSVQDHKIIKLKYAKNIIHIFVFLKMHSFFCSGKNWQREMQNDEIFLEI